ncbi:MAG: site-specific integrase, partial [Oceanicaulis sp.]|nr:site-specific integrase [Oceanicaulis sp.]
RGYWAHILLYAVRSERADHDVSAALAGALKSVSKRHHAAITDPKRLGELLRSMQGFQGSFVVGCALRLTPYLFVRPGELRRMEWAEIDLDGRLWTLSGAKMKSRRDHLVPLSVQAVSILRDLEPLTGRGSYVFPSERGRGRPMSENTINAVLRRLGFGKDEVTAHGFRATARTLLDEVLGERPDIIEHQLAHAVRDPNGRAYNRTAHLEARRAMMQRWADYLDSLTRG